MLLKRLYEILALRNLGLTYSKSPVDNEVYDGLQVDQRAQTIREKNFDPAPSPRPLDDVFDKQFSYLNEKHEHFDVEEITSPAPSHPSPITRSSTNALTFTGPITPQTTEALWEPAPEIHEKQRICGLRRRHFWIVFLIALGMILAVALVVGLVVGRGDQHRGSTATGTNRANSTVWTPYQ